MSQTWPSVVGELCVHNQVVTISKEKPHGIVYEVFSERETQDT